MAQLDVVIRGGTLVDGTGVPRYQADVGIKDGRVARISGRIQGGGAREIDALGCIVAPGAIDLHTHYDAQLNWDPYATLSGWFGVTSVSIGQCGFGFAPTRPEDRDLNMRMMNRIASPSARGPCIFSATGCVTGHHGERCCYVREQRMHRRVTRQIAAQLRHD